MDQMDQLVVDHNAKHAHDGKPVPCAGCIGSIVGFDPPTDNTGWWVWLDVGESEPRGYPAEMLTHIMQYIPF